MKRTLAKIAFYLPFFLLANFSAYSQNNLIPNTQDCSATRPAFDFSIQRAWITSTGNQIFTDCTPLAGDIDGDGKTEILALTSTNEIYVFEGTTGKKIGTISPGVVLANWAWTGTTFCLLDGNKNGKGEVFISAQSGSIFLYEVTSEPGASTITFEQKWKKTGFTGNNSPVVADLDGDGSPEFIVGNLIFNYSGELKATLDYKGATPNGGAIGMALVVDLDKDGLPEIAVGTKVYKYSGGAATLWKECPGITAQEGSNMAADINQDGNVDLIFHSAYSASTKFVKVWTPATGEDLGVVVTGLSGQRSIPFVGDIDGEIINGKKYPEICINTPSKLYAYYYTGTEFKRKWEMTHTDASGGTILTLFDFNNDGAAELVYRDETKIRIFSGEHTGTITIDDALYSETCGSETASEQPIVVDALGGGSANIVVTGNATGKSGYGEVMLFEGKESKWASCPNVWNQQLYSSLYVNTDLTIPKNVEPVNLTFTRQDNSTVQFYNGGPLQTPYVSEETYLPVDLSPDVYIVDGTISVSGTNVTFSITFGNQGLVVASASTPIQYYKNSIASGNIVGSETLGVDLYPGQTTVITKTISGLEPQFYVRILDDGTNFPSAGAYSDCNLTNNTKSFGTLELFKTVNSSSACVDGTSIFYVDLENNTNLFGTPTNYTNIHLVDSLGNGWEFISASTINGTTTTFNPATSKLEWTIPSLNAGETARLTIVAKSVAAGAMRNTAWIESVGGTVIGKEAIEAYVIVNNVAAPSAASISPTDPKLCEASGVVLTASVSGVSTYQWYKDLIEISGATQQTYTATALGSYTVSYHDGTCVSQMSSAVVVTDDCMTASNDAVAVVKSTSVQIDVLANDDLGLCNSSSITLILVSTPSMGEVEVEDQKIKYTAYSNIGTDSFTYKIKCGSQESTATVTVIICSTLMVERIDDAKEPNSLGKFRIKYTDDSFKLEKDLEVTYSIAPVNAVAGTDFVAPSGTAIIQANTSSVDVNIQPYDNFKVEGNNRQLTLTITGSAILTTP